MGPLPYPSRGFDLVRLGDVQRAIGNEHARKQIVEAERCIDFIPSVSFSNTDGGGGAREAIDTVRCLADGAELNAEFSLVPEWHARLIPHFDFNGQVAEVAADAL
ncbi:hypothetical protein PBS_20180 [Paraburkholderia sp. 2C]